MLIFSYPPLYLNLQLSIKVSVGLFIRKEGCVPKTHPAIQCRNKKHRADTQNTIKNQRRKKEFWLDLEWAYFTAFLTLQNIVLKKTILKLRVSNKTLRTSQSDNETSSLNAHNTKLRVAVSSVWWKYIKKDILIP